MANIVISRPKEQAAFLYNEIYLKGDRPIICPFLQIVPVSENSAEAVRFLSQFDELDDVIVISPTAAAIAARLLSTEAVIYYGQQRFFAAGQSTAKALASSEYFLPLSMNQIIYPMFDSGVEALSCLSQLERVDHRKIGIIKGKDGPDLLQKTLLERKAEVFTFDLYQRIPTDFITLDGEKLDIMLASWEIDAVIVTSSEAFRYYHEWIQRALPAILQHKIKKIPLVVNHEKIQQLANDCGFYATTSTSARNQDIISTLYTDVIKREK